MKRANWNQLILLLMLSFGIIPATMAEDNASQPCHDDVQKFCADVKPGQGGVAKCLKKHRSDLSESCKSFLKNMKAAAENARDACKDDAAKLCGDVKPGRGRIAICLKEHESELSDACKEIMSRKRRR
jgi:hypothetical protein